MKRVYVNEDWCLACHLCEYYCVAANSGAENMIKAFANGKKADTENKGRGRQRNKFCRTVPSL